MIIIKDTYNVRTRYEVVPHLVGHVRSRGVFRRGNRTQWQFQVAKELRFGVVVVTHLELDVCGVAVDVELKLFVPFRRHRVVDRICLCNGTARIHRTVQQRHFTESMDI